MVPYFGSSILRLIASTCFEHLFAHHQEVTPTLLAASRHNTHEKYTNYCIYITS
jgi:hypothetical protein